MALLLQGPAPWSIVGSPPVRLEGRTPVHGVSLSSRGSGRLDTRLDTPPSHRRRHPVPIIAQCELAPVTRPCFTPARSRSACAGGAHEAAKVHGSCRRVWMAAACDYRCGVVCARNTEHGQSAADQ